MFCHCRNIKPLFSRCFKCYQFYHRLYHCLNASCVTYLLSCSDRGWRGGWWRRRCCRSGCRIDERRESSSLRSSKPWAESPANRERKICHDSLKVFMPESLKAFMPESLQAWNLDAPGWGVCGDGGTSCTPSKDFKKLYHINAIKHKNRGPLPGFSHNPKYPRKKNLKMTVSNLMKCRYLSGIEAKFNPFETNKCWQVETHKSFNFNCFLAVNT